MREGVEKRAWIPCSIPWDTRRSKSWDGLFVMPTKSSTLTSMSVQSGWEFSVGAQVGSTARFGCDVCEDWEACVFLDPAVTLLFAMAFATLFGMVLCMLLKCHDRHHLSLKWVGW